MKESRFIESQIVGVQKQVETSQCVDDVCREHSVSSGTYHNWKSKYGGMEASECKRVKGLEDANVRLKRMHADLNLAHEAAKEQKKIGLVMQERRADAKELVSQGV